MDPDVIFIILLYIIMLILTVTSIVGLSKKIWRLDNISLFIKLSVIGLFVGLLILALIKFNGTESGETSGSYVVSRWEIMIYSASFLIGLNWSINFLQRRLFQRIKLPNYLKATVSTIIFTILISTTFYLLADILVKLNLFGSGG